ncbi:MAG: carbamoyl phosphate synthase small subunit [Firmicutes bacterium HGW-Firmicutes-21]|nr:MAG: carbamoyl phosphate synthase small subunit [Firmicutes bacterium HGW-Firmicutes-21]
MKTERRAYIVLEDGQIFEGNLFGCERDIIGEMVFTTGMTGYVETLTDPSYYGQIIIQTFPMIGNYGVMRTDAESREGGISAFGYVVREKCDTPSNFRCEQDIESFLKENGITGIYGVDTRQLTSIIREKGVLNACICTDIESVDLTKISTYRVTNAVKNTSGTQKQLYKAENGIYSVALIDYGAKQNIIRKLNERGCNVTVFPYNCKAEEILDSGFDGVMLSNGPGDPKENAESIEQLKLLIGKKPIFGICLGHQLLALAFGGDTFKLKYGHRGANQPATDISTKRTYITSQNHGYAVDIDSIDGSIGEPLFINANDNTCEGMVYKNHSAFSVQFHPEACGGPMDTEFLFDRFIELMKKGAADNA